MRKDPRCRVGPTNIVYFFLFLFVLSMDSAPVNNSDTPQLLLVAFDGFGYEFLQNNLANLPNFQRFEKMSVTTQDLGNIPAYFSVTYPSFFMAMTGLYPEKNGIVANKFYDPDFNETFEMLENESDPKWWQGGEPIWVTAEKNGKRTAVIFFPGSEIEIRGFHPTIWWHYDESISFDTRVDQSFQWLREGFDFVAIYFEQPDTVLHEHGTDSLEAKVQAEIMDGVLGKFLDGLESNEFAGKVNFILMSDHGMINVDPSRSITLSEFIDESDAAVMCETSFAFIYPYFDDQIRAVYQKLSGSHPHLKVFFKEELPDKCHCKKSKRIGPIVVFPDEGWVINGTRGFPLHNGTQLMATHGYNNMLPSMRSIFYGSGPDFGSNVKVEPFSLVNYYALMCRLLQVPPSPNNGSDAVIDAVLGAKSQ